MAFEFFKGNNTEIITQEQLEEFLQDLDFADAIELLENEMEFGRHDTQDGSEPADSFEKGEDFDQAFNVVKTKLKTLDVRAPDNVILRAVASKMDPDDQFGFAGFFYD